MGRIDPDEEEPDRAPPPDEPPREDVPRDEPPREEEAPVFEAPQEGPPALEVAPQEEPPAFEAAPREEPPALEEPAVYEEAPREAPPVVEAAPPEEPAYEDAEFEPIAPEPEPASDSGEREQQMWDPAPVPDVREQDRDDLFGEPEIVLPHERRVDPRHARDVQRNLDLDLGRIKRRKRYGFFLTFVSVMFIAFFIAPVTWVGVYRFIDPPGTTQMLLRASEGQTIRHYPVPITRMSPHIVRAVIAAEDGNFCTHDGFDVEAIQDAMEANARGGRTRGASTISQQTAKNLFLWPERSWVRKGFETYFTALVEFMWPKRRIMEAYLNAAEWGDGNFGIEAAARARFGVSAEDLTPLQAARLAAVLPSPNRWRADNPGPYVRRRSATIVQRAQVVRNEHMAGCVLALDRPS